ncbi:hypothetical protein M8J77_016459 [Diaphorina citri]|nr:hypothetical protein M8J77_016459 [Diaphorina citri]
MIAEHCSVRTVDHLGEIIKELDVKSELLQSIKLHRTKCIGLINNVLSPCMLEDLICDIGQSYYSMIIDESTTIDTKKVMSLIIRYFSHRENKVVTTFYRLLEIEAGDHLTMVTAFQSALEKDGLKIDKLLGIGIDGANVMTGKYNSFSSKLKELIPHLFGYEFNKYSSTVSSNILKEIQQNCLNYLVRLGEEIQQRLPANFSLLQKLNSFSPSVATSSNKPDITDIIMHFEKICSDPAEGTAQLHRQANIPYIQDLQVKLNTKFYEK